jgi:SPP1 family predicted phage head-tail adaptor
MKTKSIPIGARARRFVLELPLERPDGFGGVIRSYAPGPQVWGAIEMISGVERVRADRPEQSLTHKVTMRYRDGVTGAMRLTSGLRRFAIRAASDPDGTRRDLVCLVKEMKA